MRRKDREIKDFEEIVAIMKRCDICRLAFHDEESPYILPLNFGMETEGRQITLFFHGAAQGKKYELLKRDSRVSFEMDCSHKLVKGDGGNGCSCTMEYECVMGRGRLEILPEEEKYHGLEVLMKHYREEEVSFDSSVMAKTVVMKLLVEQVSGKAHR